MTPAEFARRLKANRRALIRLVRQDVPKIVGAKVVGFYRDNYRKGGYVDGGFHPWKITKRQLSGLPGAANRYGPLLSKRNRLFSETRYRTGEASVTIYNNAPYAKIHNEGGEISAPVTRQMRKYFWAMYYKHGGKDSGNPTVERYKWMALTKKDNLRIKIPKRPFVYGSKEVSALVRSVLKDEIRKVITSR